MSQTSKIILAVVITALVVGGLVYWGQNPSNTSEPSTNIPTEEEQKDTSLQEYKNDGLKLAFTYPKDWGVITEGDRFPYVGQIILRLFDTTFLAANNDFGGGDRGGYWGDYAWFIGNQSSIINFCNDPFQFPDRIESCSILQNENGISYAKTQEEICSEAGCSGIATNYYLYNPNSEFRGIVISSAFLRDNNISRLDTQLDELVQSISFLQ